MSGWRCHTGAFRNAVFQRRRRISDPLNHAMVFAMSAFVILVFFVFQ
jgi:hypothetical protein